MKVLFTCNNVISHFKPLLPFARSLKSRGFEVRFATNEPLAEEIENAGFGHVLLDYPSDQVKEEAQKMFVGVAPKDMGKLYMAEVFFGIFAKTAAPALIEKLGEWRPDLIVRETTEFAGLVAAQKLGIRHVRLEIVNGESEESITTNYQKQFDSLRASVSLPPAGAGYLKDEMAFSAHPQMLDDTPRVNSQSPVRFLAEPIVLSDAEVNNEWLPQADWPLVYATFGTVAGNSEGSNGIYQTAVDAFSEIPANFLLTTGKDAPEGLISSVPPNVVVRPFVPQWDVLPHAKLMVNHGGSGTVIAGLGSGVLMVITPMFADQPDNARCLASVNLGLSVADPDVASLRAAAIKALADEGMRERAQIAAKEVVKMPSVDEAVDIMLRG